MCVKEWAHVSVGAHSSEEGIGSSGATYARFVNQWWALETKSGSSAREIHAPKTAIPPVASSDV